MQENTHQPLHSTCSPQQQHQQVAKACLASVSSQLSAGKAAVMFCHVQKICCTKCITSAQYPACFSSSGIPDCLQCTPGWPGSSLTHCPACAATDQADGHGSAQLVARQVQAAADQGMPTSHIYFRSALHPAVAHRQFRLRLQQGRLGPELRHAAAPSTHVSSVCSGRRTLGSWLMTPDIDIDAQMTCVPLLAAGQGVQSRPCITQGAAEAGSIRLQ
jgi:hypothetical protein